jgi:hypothetical protein
MKITPLITATIVGTALQLAMVLAGHVLPALRQPGYAIGGMGFSLVAGLVYAWRARAGWGGAVAGGAIAGAACAVVGIAVSALLGDVPASLLMLGTASSAVTGAVGGVIGRLIWTPKPIAG